MNNYINNNEELLDRDNEIAEITKIINNHGNKNSIILITGISGVGKSGLICKLKNSGFLSSNVVTVKMNKSSVSTLENLQYFNAICQATQEFSFKNNTLIPTPVQYGYSSLGNLIKYFFSIIKSKRGYGNAISIAESAEEEPVIRKKDYIVYVLNNANIILDIENIQNIDTQSFEILREIVETTENNVFILEYTNEEKEKSHYINLYKELLETGAEITEYRVEKMDFFYAKQLAPKNLELDINVLEKIYDSNDGNLMEIILANDKSTVNKSNIDISMHSLNNLEKHIVYTVYLNDDCIDCDLLFHLLLLSESKKQKSNFYITNKRLTKAIQNLKNRKILNIENKQIFLVHDSLHKELDKLRFDPILYYAYSSIKTYYLSMLCKNHKNKDVIEKLVFLFLKFADSELLSILPNVKELISDIKYPHLIITELENFRKKLLVTSAINKEGIYSLTILLVELCLANKLYEQAQKNLDIVFDQNNHYHLALQGEIYALQENIESKEKLLNLISKSCENSRLRLILELCLLYHSMKMDKFRESETYCKKILNNQSYKKYKEYAYALRNYAELCDSNFECINYYSKALKIFKSNGMLFDVACVYISLSMIYSYEGKLQKATECIKRAMKLDNKDLSQCYVLNNLSVINILKGTYDKITEKNLFDAILLSVTAYEKIIIYCNLLIYYCLTNNSQKAEKFANKIENSDYKKFQYEEFTHIVYQDLLYYYKWKKNTDKELYYYTKILKLINDPNMRKSTRNLAKAMNGLSNSEYFYSKYPFRVDFLGYWEFNIDNGLDHFE